MDGNLVNPGDVSKVYKVARFGRQTLDRRGWLKYVRQESVLRALNSRTGDLYDELLAEQADRFSELLDNTPLPLESSRFSARFKRALRRRGSHGVAYPRYEGASANTFYERLGAWIEDAADSPEGRRILRSAGFDGPDAAKLFAVAVTNETQGLLVEARRPPGQNYIRYEMASEIHRSVPDQHVRERHHRVRLWTRAVIAGAAAGISAELLFVDDWLQAVGFGATALATTAIAEYAVPRAHLAADMLAARRQVGRWLAILARQLADSLITVTTLKDPNTYRGVDALERILHQIAAGDAYVRPIGPDDAMVRDLHSFMENASLVGDIELRAHLLDVETAFRLAPEDLPNALRRLEGLVQEGPGTSARLTKPPSLEGPMKPAKQLPWERSSY